MALGRSAARLTPGLIRARVATLAERVADRAARLGPAEARLLATSGERVAGLARLLGSLGYRRTLERGYAVVRGPEGGLLTRAGEVAAGAALEIEFADERVRAVAGGGRPAPKAKGGSGGGGQQSLF